MSEPEQDEPQATVIGVFTATASMEVTPAAVLDDSDVREASDGERPRGDDVRE